MPYRSKRSIKNIPIVIALTAISIIVLSFYTLTIAQPQLTDSPAIYQLLSDYQYDTYGGDGALRIMTFYPSINTVSVSTYRVPYTTPDHSSSGGYETDDDSMFTIHFDMDSKDVDSFTIIALPDTQVYTAVVPQIFDAQTRWIADNKAILNIVYVIHLGDIVEDCSNAAQWQIAQRAMQTLTDANIPYSTLAGNHDGDIFTGNFVEYNTYFPPKNNNHYGSGNEDNYALFAVNGIKLLIINLRCSPTQAELDWANQIITANPSYRVILSTHSYIADSSGALDADGETIFNQVVQPNNIPLVLCGHNAREALRIDQFQH